jgi:serine protease AprX
LDTTLSKVGFPDFDQGFGLVDLGKLLKERTLNLFFADIYNTDPKALESRTPFGGAIKSYRDYEVEVMDATQDLSVTITWTDPPAKGVQNNLQLSVKTPDNEWKLGNMEHTYKKDADFDTLVDLKPLDKYNNTEKVLIPSPAPGKYRIKIAAQNTLSRQGYSLVVSGTISGFKER